MDFAAVEAAPDVLARAQRLALMTLRYHGRADALLRPFLAKRPRPAVMDVLRLAVVEVAVTGAAAYGVVNEAVAAVRAMGGKGQAAAGMVNAVLRRAVGGEDLARRWAVLSPQAMPDWLRQPLRQAYGATAVAAIEAAHERGAPLDLTPRGDVADLARMLGGDEGPAQGRILPTGSLRIDTPVKVSDLPGYGAGQFWVQDAAAALAARMLDVRAGERVADLCAAPGGKTMQMAAAGAEVTAVELSSRRAARLRDNLARTGLAARVVECDVLDFTGGPFDAILLDAPCSATGTIRRHPELPLIRDGAAIAGIAAIQARLLDHALGLLAPGGRLVYATCSLLPEEGEDQIKAALSRHAGLRVIRRCPAGVEPAWHGPFGLRLRPDYWPDLGGMDGFFLSLLGFDDRSGAD